MWTIVGIVCRPVDQLRIVVSEHCILEDHIEPEQLICGMDYRIVERSGVEVDFDSPGVIPEWRT